MDLPAAAERGVVVTNTPGANAQAVADHTLALLLASLRAGHLGACAADALAAEHGTGASPLLDAPRVTLSPHVAGHTVQAIDRMSMAAATECVRVLVEGLAPHHPVTMEEP